MSRMVDEKGGRGGKGPLDKWLGEPHEVIFSLTFKTRELVEKNNRDAAAKRPFKPGYSFDPPLELDHCLIEKVECQIIAPKDSIVDSFPTFVEIRVGSEKLTPLVKNCPGTKSIIDHSVRVVHRGAIDQDTLKKCQNFGNFTMKNLTEHHGVTQNGNDVRLPERFVPMIKQFYRSVDRTETRTDLTTFTRDEFENYLQPSLLMAVEPVQRHFYDASVIDVYVNLDPSCKSTIDRLVANDQSLLDPDFYVQISMRILCQRKEK